MGALAALSQTKIVKRLQQKIRKKGKLEREDIRLLEKFLEILVEKFIFKLFALLPLKNIL